MFTKNKVHLDTLERGEQIGKNSITNVLENQWQSYKGKGSRDVLA
jgi:hypothetical protein